MAPWLDGRRLSGCCTVFHEKTVGLVQVHVEDPVTKQAPSCTKNDGRCDKITANSLDVPRMGWVNQRTCWIPTTRKPKERTALHFEGTISRPFCSPSARDGIVPVLCQPNARSLFCVFSFFLRPTSNLSFDEQRWQTRLDFHPVFRA